VYGSRSTNRIRQQLARALIVYVSPVDDG